jgi:hypothetical protein
MHRKNSLYRKEYAESTSFSAAALRLCGVGGALEISGGILIGAALEVRLVSEVAAGKGRAVVVLFRGVSCMLLLAPLESMGDDDCDPIGVTERALSPSS